MVKLGASPGRILSQGYWDIEPKKTVCPIQLQKSQPWVPLRAVVFSGALSLFFRVIPVCFRVPGRFFRVFPFFLSGFFERFCVLVYSRTLGALHEAMQ